MWTLVHAERHAKVEIGDVLVTFHGERCLLEDWIPPHKPSSTGRIQIRGIDRNGQEYSQLFYPSVCGLKFIAVPA